jgi:hypothetical protein
MDTPSTTMSNAGVVEVALVIPRTRRRGMYVAPGVRALLRIHRVVTVARPKVVSTLVYDGSS